MWDEPATVKEAYVPFAGNRWRSISVLGEAASWFGLALVPKAANQRPPAPRPVPYGGAMVPAGGGGVSYGGRRGGDQHVHFHKVTSDDRMLTREAQQRMKVWG